MYPSYTVHYSTSYSRASERRRASAAESQTSQTQRPSAAESQQRSSQRASAGEKNLKSDLVQAGLQYNDFDGIDRFRGSLVGVGDGSPGRREGKVQKRGSRLERVGDEAGKEDGGRTVSLLLMYTCSASYYYV